MRATEAVPGIPTAKSSRASGDGVPGARTPGARWRRGCSALILLALGVHAGCAPTSDRDPGRSELDTSAATGNVIDSIFPMEEEMARFRSGLMEATELTGGAGSVEALGETFLRALEAGDRSAIEALAITKEEFAWLYFPYSLYATAPYELPPGLLWMQIENASSKGIAAALRRYEGEDLSGSRIRCAEEGETTPVGRILDHCTVTAILPNGEPVEERLFGTILEVAGRYKFVSFAGEL